QGDAGVVVLGKPGDVGEQLDEVDLDVAGVRAAVAGRDLDAGIPSVTEFGAGLGFALDEGPDGAEHLVIGTQFPYGHVQRSGQGAPQGLVGTRLQLAGTPAGADCRTAQGIEQHRLADTAQPGEHHGPLRTSPGDPFQDDIELAKFVVPSGQLGGSLTGAGCVRVL